MEAVLGGLGWGEEGAQEAREVTIDGGVGERRERFGVFDEEGAGAAGGTGAGEGELESLEPGGGIDGVGGVEGEVDGEGAELGAVLVGLGAGRFEDGEVAAGSERVEKSGGGVGVERAVDEPQERRAREAAVVEGGVGGESNLCLAESGAAGYGEEGAEGEEAGRGPVDGVGTERLAGAGGRVAAEELGEEVWAEWLLS